jgi:hypothetical protein
VAIVAIRCRRPSSHSRTSMCLAVSSSKAGGSYA